MYNIMFSMQEQLRNFMLATTTTTAAFVANTDPSIIQVADASYFNVVFFTKNYPQIMIKDAVTKDIRRAKIIAVDKDSTPNTITIADPDTLGPFTHNLSIESQVTRTPGWLQIRDVVIGDQEVLPGYPCICVCPTDKSNEWQTLTGTGETCNLDILVHVKDDSSQSSTISMVRITQDIEDLLMANLHMKITGRDRTSAAYNRPYNSFVKNVTFGHSSKGFALKSSKISWFGTEFWWRLFIRDEYRDESSFE